ncbi:ribosomal protein L7/L12 [Pseudomonas anguilliseptica]|uniref:ribosomal protein L7/L12 n=1 Tax=Pseudomonas anguilliseptica TaxID=53406 RepID=UPI0037362D57
MAEFDQDLPVQVIAALERGQKIEAIKLLRELKGIGLKEAKEAVDGYTLERHGASVVQSGGHGGIFWLLGLLVLGAAVAWLFDAF